MACVVVAAIGFSGKAVLVKLAYRAHPVDAVTLLALRMLFSLPFFLAMGIWSHRSGPDRAISRKTWGRVLMLGFVGYYLASYLDFLGLQYISAGLERLVLFLYPTLTILLSVWFLGKTITKREIQALCITYVGIALVVAHEVRLEGDASQVLLGGGLVFASAVAYSFYLIGSGETIAQLGATRFTAYAMTVASVLCVLQFALTHPWSALAMPASVYWITLMMALFSTVLPVWLLSEGIRRLGAGQASLIASVGPVATLAMGAAFLGEQVGWLQVLGAVLVLGGVLLVSAPHARVRKTA